MNADAPLPALADADSLRVREYLAEALRLDLVGPGAGHELAEERLPGWVRPSNWYLTGFLVPSDAPPEQRSDADEDDPLDETPTVTGLSEESTEERTAAKKGFFPSSVGLSFLVPDAAEELTVTVRWGDYSKAEYEGPDGDTVPVWQREPQARTVSVALSKAVVDHPVPLSGGLRLHILAAFAIMLRRLRMLAGVSVLLIASGCGGPFAGCAWEGDVLQVWGSD